MPTFRTGQLLYIRPEVQNLKPGDVIIFYEPKHCKHVVHRVVAVTSEGLTTRGDHNLQCDELPVAYGQVVGRVDTADFGGVLEQVVGGQRGLRTAKMRWLRLELRARFRQFFAAPYRVIINSPAVRRWAKCLFKLKFDYITLRTSRGTVVKALYRGRVIARWQPSLSRFECRRPYDLWLTEGDLSFVNKRQKSFEKL